MAEQVITTNEARTLGAFRRATAKLPDDMPLRDHVLRPGVLASVIKTDQGEVLEVS